MTNYRRSNIAGASYFFTVNLADRSSRMLTEHIALLRNAFEYTRSRHPFCIDAIVVLPDHLNAIWTLSATLVISSQCAGRDFAEGLGRGCG